MKIAVAGTGYVGLSIATLLAQSNEVMAVDIIPEKVEKINKKIMVICSDEVNIIKKQKTIGSNCFVPSIAGLLCASYVINDIVR